ncbi:MAG: pilus assembly protein PilP [Bdellovibrionales bacterium]|nr:pilus assembly protein PilP [Bdellovibrionales bacterium]
MKRDEIFQLSAYIVAASLAVGGAFLISSRFLAVARAQDEGAAPAAPAVVNAPPETAPPPVDSTGAPPAAPDMQTMDAQTAQAVSTANTGIAELEGFLEPFIYDIVNRRDPFQAYAEYVPVDIEGPPRAMSPAQRWELEQLKLIGIMWDIKDPKAMFLDPEEEVMILGRDESIGNRNGYIATIREGEVVVVEAIRKRGDIIYRTRVLRIER